MNDLREWVDHAAKAAPPLSAEARARRSELRGQLMQTVRRRRRTRYVSRLAAAVVLLAAGGVLAMQWGGRAQPADEPGHRHMDFAVLRDDPALLSRATLPVRTIRPEVFLTDDDLLDYLESIRRPAGLVRFRGEARLTANVIDSE